MSYYKKSFKRRAFVVYAMVLLFAIFCFIQIVYLATVQRPLFSGDPKYCLDKTQPNWEQSPLANDPNRRCVVGVSDINSVRGDILDDQGNILASDFTVFDFTIDGRKLLPIPIRDKKGVKIGVNDTLYITKDRRISRSDKEAIRKLITELTDQFYYHFKYKFPYNKEYYRKKLTEAVSDGKNVLILKSNPLSQTTLVTSVDTAFLRKMPLFQSRYMKNSLAFTSRSKRIYPYGELAKRAIGTAPSDGVHSGLELMFDDWLSGTKGAQKMLYIDGIRIPSKKFSQPHDGANIHTTLNLRMQNVVYEALMDELHHLRAQWGCAVIMEVATGEIKAIANLKKHTNENGNTGYFEIFNHAFRPECEPGSTFKLASLLTYLEKVPNDTAKSYMLCGCEIAPVLKLGGKQPLCKYKDPKLHRFGTPSEIFQRSLNEGIGTMIFDVYKNNFHDYLAALDSMGITMPLITQLDTMKSPQIKRDKATKYDFYVTTWGGFNMAPIQTLTYFNGVANGGRMLCPKIVSHVTEQDKVVEVFPTVVLKEQMTRKDVIDRAKKYLEAVVTGPHGTAKRYRDSIPRFAGKTGTRDIFAQRADGSWGYEPLRNSISFCGYFPVDKPKYTMIVYIYDVKPMSGAAVQLFYTIAKRIMSEETTALMNEVDKSGGIKTMQYANLGKQ